MEQLYQSILLKPAVSKRYKHFMHHLISANASFKVAHELIPYFMEFEGIDFFFRNKIEESYFKAISHLENSLAALALVRDSYYEAEGCEYLEANLNALQDSIIEVKADTSTLVRTFYSQLGTDVQLHNISRIRAIFSEIIYRGVELSSEVV
jgi:hypothetical protein